MTQTSTTVNNYFPALTGIRAIAAYMVFFHHFNPFSIEHFGKDVNGFFGQLHIGVTLFFVLSGFLIAYRYIEYDNIDFRQYIINRFARIYPVYFLLTTFTIGVFAFVFHQGTLASNAVTYLMNITFLRGLFDNFKFTGIPQGWSLTVEEMFYFSAPLFFVLIKKNKWNLTIIPLSLLAFGSLLVFIFKDVSFYGFFNSFKFMVSYTYLGRCFEFFIGIALALFFRKNRTILKTKYCTLTGAVVIIASAYCLYLLKGDKDIVGIEHPLGVLINNLIMPFFGIAVLFWGLLVEKTWLQKVLMSRLFLLLGKSSYVFYLIHMGLIYALVVKVSHNFIFVFIALNLVSIAIFKIVEEPVNLYLRRVLARKPK